MFRKYCVCILFILIALQAKAINAVVSNTVFYMPDSIKPANLLPYIETSWQIIPHSLYFKTGADKKISAKIKTDIIYTQNNEVVAEDHFITHTPPRANVNEIGANKIIDLRRYFLPAGIIIMKLKFTDINDTTNSFSFADSILIPTPPKNEFYSKLQLLDTVIEANFQSVFSKNGIEQIPLNGCFLDDDTHTLNYYAELYHSKLISKSEYPVTQKVFISKKELGSPFQLFENEDTLIAQDVSLVYGSFKTAALLTGNYYLNVVLENKYHNILATNTLFFQRLNKHPAKEDTVRRLVIDTTVDKINVLNLDKTFVAKFTMEQLRSILRMMLPISDPMGTKAIQAFLDKPEELYMRYYIYNYFININPQNPNKAWKEYSDKVILVNKMFKGQGTPGFATERGFMYLRYGPPTEIIPVENEPGALPYEIWQYNTLTQTNHKEIANAIFLFYKPNPAIEDYLLLHCTVGGETQNPNWRMQLYSNAGATTSGKNRAEEYFTGNK